MVTDYCGIPLRTFGMFVGYIQLMLYLIGSVLISNSQYRVSIDFFLLKENVSVGSIFFAFMLTGIFSSILLIFGAIKEHHLLVLPWLIHSNIFYGFSTMIQIFKIEKLMSSIDFNTEVTLKIVFTLFAVVLQLFMIYGVYLLYFQLKDNRLQRIPNCRVPLLKSETIEAAPKC